MAPPSYLFENVDFVQSFKMSIHMRNQLLLLFSFLLWSSVVLFCTFTFVILNLYVLIIFKLCLIMQGTYLIPVLDKRKKVL